MFTGIIEATGGVVGVRRHEGDVSIDVDVGRFARDDIKIGDSIAVSGPCLTVTSISGRNLSFDISAETIKRTLFGSISMGQVVNLERSLALGEQLNGHLVSGHVDGLGDVASREDDGRSTVFKIRAERDLAPFIAEKGSISVDGVSLTINRVQDGGEAVYFEVNIIPHTMTHTSLGQTRPGHRVHLEVDMIARYVNRMLMTSGRLADGGDSIHD